MSPDTIVALATPPGRSSISVIRMSGPDSLRLASRLSKSVSPFLDRRAVFLPIYIENSKIIDSAIYTYFRSPASYTGEDIIEVSCHGNPVIVSSVLDRLCHCGARIALPGEYTKRAFINGKMDLVQAESVGLLISARSKDAAKYQSKNLSGSLSGKISKIRESLLYCLSTLEYEFDISEKDSGVEDLVNNSLKLLNNNIILIDDLLGSYARSRAYQQGLRVVICGQTNAGKSTLMNALLGSNRSITSETAGTTRDTITSDLVAGGVPMTLIDTAGLRDPETPLEGEGVARTWQEIHKSDIIISVYSCDTQRIEYNEDKACLYVYNKVDVGQPQPEDMDAIPVSALCGDGIPDLWKNIENALVSRSHTDSNVLVNTARQKESLDSCLDFMIRTKTSLVNSSRELDLVAFELRSAINSLDLFLGKVTSQDVLDGVFSSFCVGK